jgi:predicted O-methyltransferase YrrM
MYLIKKSTFILKNYGIKTFIKKAFQFPINKINFLKQRKAEKNTKENPEEVIKMLKSFSSNNIEEVFDFSWNFYNGLIRPMQIKEEFVELLKIFQELDPKYILEIGTANGGTLFCFCKLSQNDATIISIDLPEGPFGGGYPEWKIPIYQAFVKENQKLYLLRKDSHQEETLEEVKKILNGNQLDFLFIDGDHSYEGVKKDFEMYSPLVKKGGIVAFHDIVKHPPEIGCEVEKLWEEIKNSFNFKELIKDINQNWAGIGVISKLS